MTYGRPGVYVNQTLLPAPIQISSNANAAGAVFGAFSKGPSSLTRVSSWGEFTTLFGGYSATFPATFGVAQFFNNGGADLYVKRVLGSNSVNAYVNIVNSSSATVSKITAKNPGLDGNNLRVRVTSAGTGVYNLYVYKEIVASELGLANVDASNDLLLETYNSIVFNDINSSSFIETVLTASPYISASNTNTSLTPATNVITNVLPLANGSDGSAPVVGDYTAVLNVNTSEFNTVDRPLVLFAPELYTRLKNVDADASAPADLATVHNAMIAWANSGTGFAVLDTAPALSVDDAIDYANNLTDSAQAALYYCHYYISDPLGRSSKSLRKIGPAGAVAGLYISTDKNVGPFKAPAGITASIKYAIQLERAFTPADLDSLNTGLKSDGTQRITAVNAIRNLPGAGIVVMGARTLLQDGTANRYVNMVRSLIYINKTVQNITRFAVFQNNDSKLWGQLKTVIGVFLNQYRNQGGLRGTTPEAAYFVKVDSDNNPDTSTGVVNIQVGVSLEYPAEYIVINLTQTTGA